MSDPNNQNRLPSWFRQNLPSGEPIQAMRHLLRKEKLSTVCEEALCPNAGKCWKQKTATFMILGKTCTRACRFCSVSSGRPHDVDPEEPHRVANAVKELNLNYVVVTSVTRDDLSDEGAGQFIRTIQSIKTRMPRTKIEVLIPDFSGRKDLIAMVVRARPDVISHNLETVKRLSSMIRPQADYQRSLDVLRTIHDLGKNIIVKSGLMVGLGETDEEVYQAMADLAGCGCRILTIGQYLAPTKKSRHIPVARFVHPHRFKDYETQAYQLGFRYVTCAPLVRSSFMAEEGYHVCANSQKEETASV